MPQHTAAEREKNRRGKSAAAIAALDASEQGTPTKPKKPKKAAPRERVGTGRDDSQTNFDRLAAGLRSRISAARKTGDNTLAAKLEARLAELRKTVQ